MAARPYGVEPTRTSPIPCPAVTQSAAIVGQQGESPQVRDSNDPI